jgi:hypothetical protein
VAEQVHIYIRSRVFGLPGVFGMEQVEPSDLRKPTRWDFDT